MGDDVMICRACDLNDASTDDGLCDTCATEADHLDGIRTAHAAMVKALHRWERAEVTAGAAMLQISAIEQARR